MKIRNVFMTNQDRALFEDFLPDSALQALPYGRIGVCCAVDMDEDLVTGAAAMDVAGETAELLGVAVLPEYERKGIGSGLVDELAATLIRSGTPAIGCYLGGGEDDPDGISRFLWHCGFSPTEDYADKTMTLGELLEIPVFKKLLAKRKIFPNIKFIAKCPFPVRKEFIERIAGKTDYSGSQFKNVLRDVSTYYMQGDKAAGCVYIGKDTQQLLAEASADEDTLSLEYVYLDSSVGKGEVIPMMLAQSLAKTAEDYGPEQKIRILCVNTVSEKLLEGILGKNAAQGRLARWELSLERNLPAEAEPYYSEEEIRDITASSSPEETSLTGDLFMRPVSNDTLACRDCLYRLEGPGVLDCHKYSMKPSTVIMRGECPKYRRQL